MIDIFCSANSYIFPQCLINCHYPAKSWEKRIFMCTQLSPQRTVNHKTSICITNDRPGVACCVGRRSWNVRINFNTFVQLHVWAITEQFSLTMMGNEWKACFHGEQDWREAFCLFNLVFHGVSHTTCGHAGHIVYSFLHTRTRSPLPVRCDRGAPRWPTFVYIHPDCDICLSVSKCC